MSRAGDRPEWVLNRALLLLAPAITIVVASEFIVVGLLAQLAQDLHIPLAQAGELAGWWAFSAAVAGPFVTLFANRLAPRASLVWTLLLFALGNAAVAFANSFALMLLARVIQGAVLPAFVSVGASLVSSLAPPSGRGKALARANVGFVLGVLLALPASVVLAQGENWRLPFALLAVASLLMAGIIGKFFPQLAAGRAQGIAEQLGLLGRPAFLLHLGLSVLLFAAMFAAYTYLGAWMEDAFRLSSWHNALLLFLFGTAGLAGNGIAGRFADRAAGRMTLVALLLLVMSINVAVFGRGSLLLAAVPLALWSIAHTASVTLSQVRVTLAGESAPAFAMTLNISAANLGIAIGTFAGGWFIDSWGLDAIGVAPLAFSALAIPFIFMIGLGTRAAGLSKGSI